MRETVSHRHHAALEQVGLAEELGGSRIVTMAMFIENQVVETLNWQAASATAMSLLAVCVALVVGFERVLGLERVWR